MPMGTFVGKQYEEKRELLCQKKHIDIRQMLYTRIFGTNKKSNVSFVQWFMKSLATISRIV